MPKRFFNSFKSWASDWLIEHWPAIVAVAFSGGGMTYLAKASEFLQPYGPVVWGAIGITTIVLLSLSYLFYSMAKSKSALANYANQRREVYSVNVLAPTHNNERIDIANFFHPFFKITENVRFEDCELFGPASMFLDRCNLTGCNIHDCEIVIVRPDRPIKGVTAFKQCSFINCALYRVTWVMNYASYMSLPEAFRSGIPVISDGRIGDI